MKKIKNTVRIDGFDIPCKLIGTEFGRDMIERLRSERAAKLALAEEKIAKKKAVHSKTQQPNDDNPLRALLIGSDNGNYLVPTEAQYM